MREPIELNNAMITNEIQVDKDIFATFVYYYFGANIYKDVLKAVVYRAYRDLNRTIKFNNKEDDFKLELKNEVYEYFKLELENPQFTVEKDFNSWHEKACNHIIKIYLNKGENLHYGQAQKWINMTLKYLYMLGEINDKYKNYLHIPIDNVIIDRIQEEFDIRAPKIAWSQWTNNEYIEYQNDIRKKIKANGVVPFEWEMKVWVEQ